MNDSQTTCDARRIELFLSQQLSEPEQTALELHLDDCETCRRRLEAAAAGDDVWSEARDYLRRQQTAADGPSSEASAFDSAAGGDAAFNQEAVLKLLAPTDDDRMLGRLARMRSWESSVRAAWALCSRRSTLR